MTEFKRCSRLLGITACMLVMWAAAEPALAQALELGPALELELELELVQV